MFLFPFLAPTWLCGMLQAHAGVSSHGAVPPRLIVTGFARWDDPRAGTKPPGFDRRSGRGGGRL